MRTPASADDERGFPPEVCGPDVGSKGVDQDPSSGLSERSAPLVVAKIALSRQSAQSPFVAMLRKTHKPCLRGYEVVEHLACQAGPLGEHGIHPRRLSRHD
jgi:hypothetical protein